MKYKKLERDRKILMIISCYIRNVTEVDIGKSWIMNQTVTKPVSKPKQNDAYSDEDDDSDWIED